MPPVASICHEVIGMFRLFYEATTITDEAAEAQGNDQAETVRPAFWHQPFRSPPSALFK